MSRHLLNLYYHERPRVKRRESHGDVDDSLCNARLWIVAAVAFHKVGLLRRRPGKFALHEEPLHEGSDSQLQL